MIAQQFDQKAIKATLLEERAVVAERIQLDEKNLQAKFSGNPDQIDRAQDYLVRERRTTRLAAAHRELAQIDTALHRLETGTYGLCTRCGQPISPERLKVLPYTALCIDCQAQAEQTH